MGDVQPNRDEYTVGWICALTHELDACRFMLDEEFDDLEASSQSDTNAYVLGRVGKHNVAVACLPEGLYGTISAATVATNLLASFPSVRFGVLVGVGGGVPTEVDIRLGDVVVSKPEGTEGVPIRDFNVQSISLSV